MAYTIIITPYASAKRPQQEFNVEANSKLIAENEALRLAGMTRAQAKKIKVTEYKQAA